MLQNFVTVYRQSSLIRIITGTITSGLVVDVISEFNPRDMIMAATVGATVGSIFGSCDMGIMIAAMITTKLL